MGALQEPKTDGDWQNVMGAFPSIKLGVGQYCSSILGIAPQELERPTPFSMYKDEDRKDKMIYSRVPFDKLDRIQRMRDKTTKFPVFGSYSEEVGGITNEMKRQCQLCAQYGYPRSETDPLDDDICKSTHDTKDIKFKWKLDTTLHDSRFNEFVDSNIKSHTDLPITLRFGLGTNLTSTDHQEKVEGLVGMQLNNDEFGQMLPYKRRPCKGDLQNLPVGVPGICEFDQNRYAVREEDEIGLKCPVQQVRQSCPHRQALPLRLLNIPQASFPARCLHPFWQNDERFIWPTAANGFTTDVR